MDDCNRSLDTPFGSAEAFLDHKRSFHGLPERDLVQIKRFLDEGLDEASDESSSSLRSSHTVAGQGPSKRVRVA